MSTTLQDMDFRRRSVGDQLELDGRAGAGAVETALGLLDGDPVDLRWSFGDRAEPGEPVRLTATTTRCRTTESGGTVHRHLALARPDGTGLGQGSVAFRFSGTGDPVPQHIRTDFCTVAWARELLPLLENNAEFTASTTPMDGVIGLAAGDESIQLRVYKGRIMDVGRSTPSGPTFTLSGSELAWTELVTAPRNDFIPRTMSGRFTASGNKHEYLRFTKAIVAFWDCVRELAGMEVA
jgi:hypothetical protein